LTFEIIRIKHIYKYHEAVFFSTLIKLTGEQRKLHSEKLRNSQPSPSAGTTKLQETSDVEGLEETRIHLKVW